MIKKQVLGIRKLLLAELICLSLSCAAACSASREPLYLIRYVDLPGWQPVHMMNTLRISKLDEQKKLLEDVWSLPDGKYAADCKIYPRQKLLVVKTQTEGYSDDEIFVVSLDSLKTILRIDVQAVGLLQDYPLLTRGQDDALLRIVFFRNDRTLQYLTVDLRSGDSLTDSLMPEGTSAVLLAGRFRDGRDNDIEVYRIEPDRTVWLRQHLRQLTSEPVPNSMVAAIDSSQWICFLREPDYFLLGSVPVSSAESNCKVLAFNRLLNQWRSYDVPGETSCFRLIGDWVGGEVNHGREASTDSAFVLDPLKGRLVVDSLGELSWILWADDDTIWYRSKWNLCRAKIGQTGFEDREIIFDETSGSHISLAFRLPGSQEK